MIKILTVIKNAEIMTRIQDTLHFEHHDIFIEDSKIKGFDLKYPQNARVIDMHEQILLPLFFNIHCHLGESLYDIEGNCWTISKYLKYTSDITDNMSPEERDKSWNQSAEFTIQELLKAGTGGFCAARSADIARKYHFCTMSGYPLMLSEKLRKYHTSGLDGYINYYHQNVSPSCAVGIFLHSLYKSDTALLQLASECFRYQADFITVHISEDRETREAELKLFQKPPVFVLNEYGLLTDKTVLVHGGYLSDQELSLIQEKNAVIAICPLSNMFLNTKMIDIHILEKYHIRWCLATDGLATGRTFSMIRQAKTLKQQFPSLSVQKIFEAMTTIPAQIFNRNIYSGIIEKDTSASFIAIENGSANSSETILETFFSGNLPWRVIQI